MPKPSTLEPLEEAAGPALLEVKPGLRVQGGGEIVGLCGGERVAWAIVQEGDRLRQIPLAAVVLESGGVKVAAYVPEIAEAEA